MPTTLGGGERKFSAMKQWVDELMESAAYEGARPTQLDDDDQVGWQLRPNPIAPIAPTRTAKNVVRHGVRICQHSLGGSTETCPHQCGHHTERRPAHMGTCVEMHPHNGLVAAYGGRLRRSGTVRRRVGAWVPGVQADAQHYVFQHFLVPTLLCQRS